MDDIELRAQLEKHHTASYGWALSCCSQNRTEAKDVLQTAYLKILEGRARFGGKSTFRTWLFSVIRNTAADERRRHWLRRLGLAKFAEEKEIESSLKEGKSDDEQQEVTKAFKAALKELPRRQQEVLHLVFYQDMTLEEASEAMEVSIGSARTHYERAKLNLRKYLDAQGDET